MKKDTKSLRSPLSRARGLGSAQSGAAGWFSLRLLALTMVPLSFYVTIGFLNNVVAGGYSGAIYWLQSPLSATATILLVIAAAKHGAHGMKEIFEDYVPNEVLKIVMIWGVNLLAAGAATLGTLSVTKIFLGV